MPNFIIYGPAAFPLVKDINNGNVGAGGFKKFQNLTSIGSYEYCQCSPTLKSAIEEYCKIETDYCDKFQETLLNIGLAISSLPKRMANCSLPQIYFGNCYPNPLMLTKLYRFFMKTSSHNRQLPLQNIYFVTSEKFSLFSTKL